MTRRLGRPGIGEGEGAIIRDVVRGVQRHLRLLDHLLQGHSRMRLADLERGVIFALRIGAYRVLRQTRTPRPVAVKESVDLIPRRSSARARGFANAVLRALCNAIDGPRDDLPAIPESGRDLPFSEGGGLRFRETALPDPRGELREFLSVAYSHPRWVVDRWLTTLGSEAAVEALRAGSGKAPMTIRANRLRTSRDELLHSLNGRGCDAAVGEGPDSIRILKARGLLSTPEFSAGHFYVQDETPQRVAPSLEVRPGLRCLDLCASPGGKSTHIAELMGDDGQVLACDISEAKLERIEENCRRLGVRSVSPALIDPTEEVLPFGGTFHRVLVDAPCSNSGVFRRRPEARWRLGPGSIPEHHCHQLRLLELAAPLLAPDGILIYSTCSLEPEENRDVVGEFLRRRDDFLLVTDDLVLPRPDGPDGGYMARLVRSER